MIGTSVGYDENFPVLTDDDPLLREVSDPVTEFDDDLVRLVSKMLATMRAKRGRGLAAIQIGVKKRVVVAFADGVLHVMVNPVITRTLKRFSVEQEGCLSIPGTRRNVSRPAKCDITYQDVLGELYSGTFTKESARVLQHEIDHLDGKLITDHPHAKL